MRSINEIKHLIRENKIEIVFDELLLIFGSKPVKRNVVLLIQNQYQDLRRKSIAGTITNEDKTIAENKIKSKLIELILEEDDSIVSRIKNNDREAYKALYETSFPIVKKFVISNKGSIPDAEDVFTDAVFTLYKYLDERDFKTTSQINNFLSVVSKRIWWNKLRKNKKEFPLGEMDELGSTGTIDLFELHSDVRIEIIEESLNELGEQCKLLMLQYYYEGKKIREIAENENMTFDSVKIRLFRCRQKLRSIVQKKMSTK